MYSLTGPNWCSLADGPNDSRNDLYDDRMELYWMAAHLDILHLIQLGCVNGGNFQPRESRNEEDVRVKIKKDIESRQTMSCSPMGLVI